MHAHNPSAAHAARMGGSRRAAAAAAASSARLILPAESYGGLGTGDAPRNLDATGFPRDARQDPAPRRRARPRQDLDMALQFESQGLTKGAFAAQVVFITLITTALFAGFVMFFFFVIASKVERNVVQTSVTNLVDEFIADAQIILPQANMNKLRAAAATLQPPAAVDADAEVTARNTRLLKHAGMVLGIAVLVIAVAVVAAYFSMRAGVKRYQPSKARPGAGYPDMSKVMIVAACSLAAAAVAEFAFLFTVAARYQPLDNNSAKHALVTQLLAIANAGRGAPATPAVSGLPAAVTNQLTGPTAPSFIQQQAQAGFGQTS
jgi:hypothetical protein